MTATDWDEATETIRALAARIRRKDIPGSIGVTTVQWVQAAIKDADTHVDADLIRRTYPQEFARAMA